MQGLGRLSRNCLYLSLRKVFFPIYQVHLDVKEAFCLSFIRCMISGFLSFAVVRRELGNRVCTLKSRNSHHDFSKIFLMAYISNVEVIGAS